MISFHIAGCSRLAIAAMIALCAPTGSGTAQEPLPTVQPRAGDAAGSERALVIPRRRAPIDLDGRVDEAAWQDARVLPAVVHTPTFGTHPSEATTFRIAYDDDYIFFACEARDSEPSGIRARSLERDEGSFANDWCAINLDTFNDEETAQVFATSPAGIRTEVVFPDDAEAAPNFSWNTFWDAAVHRDERGWSAEIRIPLSSLRFGDPDGDGRVIMGLAAWRLIARKNEFISWPAISPEWGGVSLFKASQFQDGLLESIEPHQPLYITPYALGGVGLTYGLNDTETSWNADDERISDVGLDLKYSPVSNVSVDLTFNTDFAQVEADNQQVNLTRFSLFFPEKRLFFQERGTVFDFSVGGQERLFHSRRVGLEAGEQVPILAGARVVARLGEWDVGVLDMQTGESGAAPSENMGAVRVRRRVLNENSYLGGIVTSRLAASGAGRNVVYGLDTRLRLFGQDYLTVNWAQAFDENIDSRDAVLGDGLARAFWERRGVDGLVYSVDVARIGDAFVPGLGFLFRRDYTRALASASYGWRPGEESRLLQYSGSLDGEVYRRNIDGSVESAAVQPEASATLKSGRVFRGSVSIRYESLLSEFELSDDAAVPPGIHRFASAGLYYGASTSQLFRVNLSGNAGGYFDGRILSASISPTWNASRHLELSGTYSVNAIEFPDRAQSFTAHLARLRTELRLNTRVSTAAFFQYNSATNLLSANVRFRYNPSEGHDLYLVWNEGINSDRDLVEPRLPRTNSRTILVKYSRTLTFGL